MKGFLRKQIFENLNLVKELLITEADVKLIISIEEKGSVTCTDVKEFWNAELNHISTKLNSLFNKGYLMRRCLKSSSGGIEYVYWVFMG